ncbi:DUF397 domain-containing protein [Streptomyces sp. NPDC021093]|uniref:DUF397 domain-containing protein n=1 Tax=Streptomyces sp. NPDC021093 TaxID=3365112 RepID=UPI0037A18735
MTGGAWEWFKSSYSGGNETECVETAFAGDSAAVRDSKSPGGPLIAVRCAAWGEFVRAVRRGDLSPE